MSGRIRRSAGEARERILETAERLLIAGGPDAVRVQVVARELGITDAAVHHHFGNREGLLEALVRYGARRLKAELERELDQWSAGATDFECFAGRVLDTMESRGYARLVMWLTLTGWRERGSGMFAPLVEKLRTAREPSQPAPEDPEQTRFLAALFLMALIGEPLFGETARRSVGLDRSAATTARFRAWLVDTVRNLAGVSAGT